MAKYADLSPKVLANLEQGMTNKDAAEQAGIDEATFYRWVEEKSEFRESVKRARGIGDKRAIQDVEATLLSLAKGYEFEDVRTEYGSELNPATGKYEPVIKKQVRTKRTVPANTEAIKFFLTNKASSEWKNRQEHEIANADALKGLRIDIDGIPDGDHIVNSEDDIKD